MPQSAREVVKQAKVMKLAGNSFISVIVDEWPLVNAIFRNGYKCPSFAAIEDKLYAMKEEDQHRAQFAPAERKEGGFNILIVDDKVANLYS
jgi:hypothetical protein